jgi:hypothetical protein
MRRRDELGFGEPPSILWGPPTTLAGEERRRLPTKKLKLAMIQD